MDDARLKFEFFKHLTTLNALAIGLMITLADRLLLRRSIDLNGPILFFWFGTSFLLSVLSMGWIAAFPTVKVVPVRVATIGVGLLSVLIFLVALTGIAQLATYALEPVPPKPVEFVVPKN